MTLRRFAVASLSAVFWLFSAFYISYKANPRGDGLEWVAMVPATGIFLVLVAPGLLLGLLGRLLAVAAALVVAGALFNVLLFVQIAQEFASK